MARFISKKLKSLVPFALLIMLWQLASSLQLWSSFVLPAPQQVLATFWLMLERGELTEALLVSFRRIAIGFSLAFLLAFALGLFTALFPKALPFYGSLLDIFRHISPLSLVPLLILWFGIGETPKLIVIIMASFFPMLLNINSGLASCDVKLIEVGRVLGFSKWQILRRIMLPNAVPGLLVGMRIGLGYSLRAIIGAEMIAAASGLGYLILDAQTMSRTDKALVGIIVIGLLGLLIDYVFKLLIAHFLPYYEEVD